jgi:hypothetical protein
MANPKTPGDLFFEKYCELNGYLSWYEPGSDLLGRDIPTEPDYLIERGGDRAVVEVKHFTTRRETERLIASPTHTAMFGGRELYGTLQAAIRAAGEQLAPLATLSTPLVVVVANPLNADVSFYRDDVVSALFGEVKLRVTLHAPVDPTPTFSGQDAAVLHRQPDGHVVNRLPHVSAVVAVAGVEPFWHADVYDLSGAPEFAGAPLPRTMFDAEGDTWLGFLAPGQFGRLSGS